MACKRVSTAADQLPQKVYHAVRSLPEDSRHLLSQLEVSADDRTAPHRRPIDLKSLRDRLQLLISYLLKPEGAQLTSIISDCSFCETLLKLVATAVRQPVDQLQPGQQGTGRSGGSFAAAVSNCLTDACRVLYGVCTAWCNHGTLHTAARPPELLVRMLRMESLQACSQQLAAASAWIARTWSESQGEGRQSQLRQARSAAREAFVRSSLLMSALTLVVDQLRERNYLAVSFLTDFAPALCDSYILEHTARVLMDERLQVYVEEPTPKGVGARSLFSDKYVCQYLQWYTSLAVWCEDLELRKLLPKEVAQQLCSALSGRCAQHVVLLHAVAALCAADGGTSYGLPPEVMARVPPMLDYRAESETVHLVQEQRAVPPQSCSEVTFLAVISALSLTTRARPPGHKAARTLLMRITAVAMAMAAEWLEPTGFSMVGWPAQAGSGRPAPPPDGSGMQRRRHVLEPQLGLPLALTALKAVAQQHGASGRWDGASDRWDAVACEWWSMAVPAVRAAYSFHFADLRIVPDMFDLLQQALGSGMPQRLPVPSPELKAVTSAGLLELLELWVRDEARISLYHYGTQIDWHKVHLSDRALAVLLAYSNPRKAAAFFITVRKFLPRAAHPNGPKLSGVGMAAAILASVRWLAGAPEGGAPAEAAVGAVPEVGPAGEQPPAGAPVWLWQYALLQLLPAVSRTLRTRLQPGTAVPPDCLFPALDICQILQALIVRWEEDGVWGSGEQLFAPLSDSPVGAGRAWTAPGPHDVVRSWLRFLLEEVEVLQLLDSFIRADYPRAPAGAPLELQLRLRSQSAALIHVCHYVAVTFPEQLRAALCPTPPPPAAAAAARATAAHATAVAGATGGSVRGVTAGATAGQGPGAVLSWDPDRLRWISARTRDGGEVAAADAGEALARRVERWRRGARDTDNEGEELSHRLPPPTVWNGPLPVLRVWLTPAEVRLRAPRTCGNPGCTNIEGNTEMDLRLRGCARCGEVVYCRRECQLAHWRAGHREACKSSKARQPPL